MCRHGRILLGTTDFITPLRLRRAETAAVAELRRRFFMEEIRGCDILTLRGRYRVRLLMSIPILSFFFYSCGLLPQEREKILFIGDSQISLWDTQSQFTEYNIVNQGLSGDGIENMTRRLRHACASDTFDKIVILIGINDISNSIRVNMADSETIMKMTDGFLKIVDFLNALQLHYFIISILPVSRHFAEPPFYRMNSINYEVNHRISGLLAATANGTYIDGAGMVSDFDRTLLPLYSRDGLHLNYLGYERLQMEVSHHVGR